MNSFQKEVAERIDANGRDPALAKSADAFLRASLPPKYSYNFSWLGCPIIQYPQDIVAMQEIIWDVKPDLIVETGVAHGGSLVFSAAMLELVAACGGGEGEVLGVDVEIRPHNRTALERHPLFRRIGLIEGSSVAPDVVAQVRRRAQEKKRILVCLDSNHTHDHVLAELEAYAPLVSPGSYCVVFDTVIEDMPAELSGDRPWGPGNNPKTAAREWLKTHPEFVVDANIQNKLLITVAPDGYLKRIA